MIRSPHRAVVGRVDERRRRPGWNPRIPMTTSTHAAEDPRPERAGPRAPASPPPHGCSAPPRSSSPSSSSSPRSRRSSGWECARTPRPGRVAVSQGRRALAAGDLDRALERFREAERRFAPEPRPGRLGARGRAVDAAAARQVVRRRRGHLRGRRHAGRRGRRPHDLDRRAFPTVSGRSLRSGGRLPIETLEGARRRRRGRRRRRAQRARHGAGYAHVADPCGGRRRAFPGGGAGRAREPGPRLGVALDPRTATIRGVGGAATVPAAGREPVGTAWDRRHMGGVRDPHHRRRRSFGGLRSIRSSRCPRPSPTSSPLRTPTTAATGTDTVAPGRGET